MATATWSQTIEHTSDATFRVWGKKISDELQLMSGLTKTGDTGQINWTTVTRPGTSTDAGYEVYYLNDSLHGTAPIYFRIAYGTGTNTAGPRVRITVGTGSDGAGAITGTALSSVTTTSSVTAPSSTVIARTSYLCVAEGFIGLVGWATGAAADIAICGFMIARTCDTNGDPDATGALIVNHTGTNAPTGDVSIQALRFAATAATYTRTAAIGPIFVTGAETATAISGDPQAYLAWSLSPYQQPLMQLCGVLISEVSDGSTFSATLIGATSRTYVCVARQIGEAVAAATPANWGLAMLWE